MISQDIIKLPSGCPEWVTPELLADTIETWQPYYKETLTGEEALSIILNVARLSDTITEN